MNRELNEERISLFCDLKAKKRLIELSLLLFGIICMLLNEVLFKFAIAVIFATKSALIIIELDVLRRFEGSDLVIRIKKDIDVKLSYLANVGEKRSTIETLEMAKKYSLRLDLSDTEKQIIDLFSGVLVRKFVEMLSIMIALALATVINGIVNN